MNNLLKTSSIYFIGQILSKLLWFILLPLYTNYISATDYGYYDLVISVLNVIIPVIFIEIWSGILRFGIGSSTDEERDQVLSTCAIMFVCISLVFFFGFYVFDFIFEIKYSNSIMIYSIVWLMQLIGLSLARVFGQNKTYAFSGILNVLFNVISSVVIILFYGPSIFVLFGGVTIGLMIQNVYIYHNVKIWKHIKIKNFNKNIAKKIFLFCFPLSFNTIVYWLLEGVNKVFISTNLGLEASGIYAAANKFSLVIILLANVFSLSWQEYLYRIDDIKKIELNYNTIGNLVMELLGWFSIVFLLISNQLFPILVGNNYDQAFQVIPFLIYSVYLNSINGIIVVLFSVVNNTKYNFYSKLFMALANCLLMSLLVNKIGLISSPISLSISYLIGILLQLFFSKKYISIKFPHKRFLIITGLYVVTTWLYCSSNLTYQMIWLTFIMIAFYFIYKEKCLHLLKMLKENYYAKNKKK